MYIPYTTYNDPEGLYSLSVVGDGDKFLKLHFLVLWLRYNLHAM